MADVRTPKTDEEYAEIEQEAELRQENRRASESAVDKYQRKVVDPNIDYSESPKKEQKEYKQSFLSKVGKSIGKAEENVKERALEKISSIGRAETEQEKKDRYALEKQERLNRQSEAHEARKQRSSASIKSQFRVRKQPKVSKASKQTYISERSYSGSMGLGFGSGGGHPTGNIPSSDRFMSMDIGGVPRRQVKVSRQVKIQQPVGNMPSFTGGVDVSLYGIPSKQSVRKQSKKLQRFEEPDYGQSIFNTKPQKYVKSKKSVKSVKPDYGQNMWNSNSNKYKKSKKNTKTKNFWET